MGEKKEEQKEKIMYSKKNYNNNNNNNCERSRLSSVFNGQDFLSLSLSLYIYIYIYIIESVDSISRDEPDSSLTQYITNAGISRARYTIMLFKHHHRVIRLISNRISV